MCFGGLDGTGTSEYERWLRASVVREAEEFERAMQFEREVDDLVGREKPQPMRWGRQPKEK